MQRRFKLIFVNMKKETREKIKKYLERFPKGKEIFFIIAFVILAVILYIVFTFLGALNS